MNFKVGDRVIVVKSDIWAVLYTPGMIGTVQDVIRTRVDEDRTGYKVKFDMPMKDCSGIHYVDDDELRLFTKLEKALK